MKQLSNKEGTVNKTEMKYERKSNTLECSERARIRERGSERGIQTYISVINKTKDSSAPA